MTQKNKQSPHTDGTGQSAYARHLKRARRQCRIAKRRAWLVPPVVLERSINMHHNVSETRVVYSLGGRSQSEAHSYWCSVVRRASVIVCQNI